MRVRRCEAYFLFMLASLPVVAFADTPVTVTYVRSFSVGGWTYFCSGGQNDIGDCEANRFFGKARFTIKVDSAGYVLAAKGKCAGKIHSRAETWDLDVISAGMATDDLATNALEVVRSLPKACKAPATPQVEKSLRDAAAFLVEFAD
jgi:hypothetical protein